MIHELLFNLWNNPGNTVVTDESDVSIIKCFNSFLGMEHLS